MLGLEMAATEARLHVEVAAGGGVVEVLEVRDRVGGHAAVVLSVVVQAGPSAGAGSPIGTRVWVRSWPCGWGPSCASPSTLRCGRARSSQPGSHQLALPASSISP